MPTVLFKCGCKYIEFGGALASRSKIKYCATHAKAPEMLEFIHEVAKGSKGTIKHVLEVVEQARALLAEMEGSK